MPNAAMRPARRVFAFFENAAFVGLVAPGGTDVLAGGVVAHGGGVETFR